MAESLANLSAPPAAGDLISAYQAFFTAVARLPG